MIDMIGNQGILIEAVGRVGVGQVVRRRPDAVADGIVRIAVVVRADDSADDFRAAVEREAVGVARDVPA